jgi:hypothetical protein
MYYYCTAHSIEYWHSSVVLLQQVKSNQFFNSSASKDQQHWHNIRSIERFVTVKFPVRYTHNQSVFVVPHTIRRRQRQRSRRYRRIGLLLVRWFSSPPISDHGITAATTMALPWAAHRTLYTRPSTISIRQQKPTTKTRSCVLDNVFFLPSLFFVSATPIIRAHIAQGHKTATYSSLIKMYLHQSAMGR